MTPNPGSLWGHIPGWDGEEYAELVRDEEEFRQWVRHGISDRLREGPAARRILEHQVIGMPAACAAARMPLVRYSTFSNSTS